MSCEAPGHSHLRQVAPYNRGTSGSHPAMNAMGMSAALERGAAQRAVQRADEQVLVRQAQAGNRPAFEELVRRYDRDVLRLALNLVRGAEDARDLYQEIFLRAYRNLARFRFECSFYTWIYRIATNVCLDHLRRKNTRREEQAPQTRGQRGRRAGFLRPASGASGRGKSGAPFSGPGTGEAHRRGAGRTFTARAHGF